MVCGEEGFGESSVLTGRWVKGELRVNGGRLIQELVVRWLSVSSNASNLRDVVEFPAS